MVIVMLNLVSLAPRRFALFGATLALAGGVALQPAPAYAWHGGGWGYGGGWGWGVGLGLGAVLGAEALYGWPGYYPYAPYAGPYYPAYTYPAAYPAYAPAAAPVQQAAGVAAASWYYCSNPQGYYPYVQSCQTAWQPVPATPPPPAPR